MPVASMPMYDMPEVRSILDSLWVGLAKHLKREGLHDVPNHILHDHKLADLWNDPNLWFSQCCGYDIVKRYAGILRPIATPHYGAPGCRSADYASIVVVAEDSKASDVLEMAGVTCVVNGLESHSGTNALKALIAPSNRAGRFFSAVKVSGAHIASLRMIQRGEADVAAIDCVTYALLESYSPAALTGIRKLGRTYRAPAIPYITRWDSDGDRVERQQAAVFNAFADPHLKTVRQALYLKNIETLPVAAYKRIQDIEDKAGRMGYAQLR